MPRAAAQKRQRPKGHGAQRRMDPQALRGKPARRPGRLEAAGPSAVGRWGQPAMDARAVLNEEGSEAWGVGWEKWVPTKYGQGAVAGKALARNVL